jgi:Replication-relaxation
MMEALHTLGARGRALLAELGCEQKLALERHPPANRRHFLGINDIRVAVLKSAEREGIPLQYFYACWELAGRGWPYAMVPDAVAEVEHAGKTATALFEYDRATEGLAYLIERKLKRYAEGLDGFAFARVITVVEHRRRLDQLVGDATRTLGDPRFIFLLRDDVGCWSVRELLDPSGSGGRSREGSGGRTGMGG